MGRGYQSQRASQPDLANAGRRDPRRQDRYEACGVAGVEPRFETYVGNDPVGFTIAQNKLRRHLELAVLALTVAKLCKLQRGGDRGNEHTGGKPFDGLPDRTIAEVAEEAGISQSTLGAAKTVLELGEPNVIEMVYSGAVGTKTLPLLLETLRESGNERLSQPT